MRLPMVSGEHSGYEGSVRMVFFSGPSWPPVRRFCDPIAPVTSTVLPDQRAAIDA